MPRVEVNLWSGLRAFADGAAKVEVEAETVGEALRGLAEKHPGLAPLLEDEVSVVVDGRVIVSGQTEPISEGSEVWLMQRLRGG
jgi:molybdopterin converting factor small subunit